MTELERLAKEMVKMQKQLRNWENRLRKNKNASQSEWSEFRSQLALYHQKQRRAQELRQQIADQHAQRRQRQAARYAR